MSNPYALVSLTELKTYLGITGTADDVLIASVASNASAIAQRDTSRVFAVQSNVTNRYSTDGQFSVTIHDRPYNDATRTVLLNGATLTEGTSVWFLPDRRDPDASVTVQVRPYTNRLDWYKADPMWWDKNMDSPRYALYGATPLDLVISGTVGHPTLPNEVKMAVTELAAFLYWRAKGGASSYAAVLTGETVDLSETPQAYQNFVKDWTIRTAVTSV